MSLRPLLALALVAALSGCMWEGRPDGAEAVHSTSDGVYDDDGPQSTPLGGQLTDGEVFEPLDVEPITPNATAPVPLDQPVPTTGPADATSEVEEALTPGSEL